MKLNIKKHTLCAGLAVAAVALMPACAHQAQGAGEIPPEVQRGELTSAQDRPSMQGAADKFTGQADISMLFMPNGPRNASAAYVTFQPGARTAWHTHPAGQTLVVTDGTGWVYIEGEGRRDMRSGDVVWVPPNTRHWHGATDNQQMTHMAVQSQKGGAVVKWMELVSDEQYLSPE